LRFWPASSRSSERSQSGPVRGMTAWFATYSAAAERDRPCIIRHMVELRSYAPGWQRAA
jgi:hypothetical protein